MGVPGAEDLKGILKAIAWQFFGKDFDLEDEARKLGKELLDAPDLMAHGMARQGYGLPLLAQALGIPFPTLDRSRAFSLGNIMPIDFGALFGPTKEQSRAMVDTAQRASGAAFGMTFNIYKAVSDISSGALGTGWGDYFKASERALPRFVANLSKMYRAFSEGRERTRTGATVIRYDVSDPTQMMEALALGAGYQPLRLSATWDRIIAEREATTVFSLRREGLMRQLWHSRENADDASYQRVLGAIRTFNRDLPDEARGFAISAENIKQSFQTRARAKVAAESGVPRARREVPLVRKIRELHPNAEVDVRETK